MAMNKGKLIPNPLSERKKTKEQTANHGSGKVGTFIENVNLDSGIKPSQVAIGKGIKNAGAEPCATCGGPCHMTLIRYDPKKWGMSGKPKLLYVLQGAEKGSKIAGEKIREQVKRTKKGAALPRPHDARKGATEAGKEEEGEEHRNVSRRPSWVRPQHSLAKSEEEGGSS